MTNERKVTYTKAVSIPVSHDQREALRRYAVEHDTAMSIVCREAALKEIGRADLSLAEETEHPIGNMLNRKDRPASKPSYRLGARLKVNMTDEQYVAIARYATVKGVTVSSVLLNAGCRVAKIAPLKPLALGRPLGH